MPSLVSYGQGYIFPSVGNQVRDVEKGDWTIFMDLSGQHSLWATHKAKQFTSPDALL